MKIMVDYNPYPQKHFFISVALNRKEVLSFDYTTKGHRITKQVLIQKRTFPRHTKPTLEWETIVFKDKKFTKTYYVKWIDQGKRDWLNNEIWEIAWEKPISKSLTAKVLKYSQFISSNYRNMKREYMGEFEKFLNEEIKKLPELKNRKLAHIDIGKLYHHIVSDFVKHQTPERQKEDSYYNKHPGHVSYGIRTPVFRKLVGSYRSQIRGLSDNEALNLAHMFYKAGIEEQTYTGTYVLILHLRAINPERLNLLDVYLGCFKSWGTIDDFCINIMQKLLVSYPKQTIPLLKKWNESPNIWKKRASVVTFTRKIGESGKYTDIALELCENLINDKEDLVRKGVSWALKDTMRGNKKKVLDYVIGLRKQGVPSVVTLYALRDIKGEEKQRILET